MESKHLLGLLLLLVDTGYLVSEAKEIKCFAPAFCDNLPTWFEFIVTNRESVLSSPSCEQHQKVKEMTAEVANLEDQVSHMQEVIRQLEKKKARKMPTTPHFEKKKIRHMAITAGPAEQPSMMKPPTHTSVGTTPPTIPIATTATETTSNTSPGCQQTTFTFPRDNTREDYVLYNGSTIPELTTVSACAWLSPPPGGVLGTGGVISYYKHGSHNGNALMVLFNSPNTWKIASHNSREAVWDNIPSIDHRSHFCFLGNTREHWANIFINGSSKQRKKLSGSTYIPGGGALVIGHEQDATTPESFVGIFSQATQLFHGKIEYLLIWDRILNNTEIGSLYRDPCFCPQDYMIAPNKTNVFAYGKAIVRQKICP